jgi:hypothetical protein
MKKLLLFGFGAIGFLSLNAQAPINHKIHEQDKNQGVSNKQNIYVGPNAKNQMSKRAETLQDVYNFAEAYGESMMLGAPESYIRWISADSNALTVYSDDNGGSTTQHNGIHVVGTSFDPKDSAFIDIGKTVLARFNPYTVDTIRWIQYYVRNVDSIDLGNGNQEVIDTVFVQYFDFSGITLRQFNRGGTNLNSAPNVDGYKAKTRLNSTALYTDTILLNTAYGDSVNYQEGRLFGRTVGTIPPDFKSLSTNGTQVQANVVAMSVFFKPMKKAQLYDTFVNWTNPNFKRTTNGLGVRFLYWTDHAQDIYSPYRINNTFWTPGFLVDGQTLNGWKSYLPTTAYSTTSMFDVDFNITVENLSARELAKDLSAVKVYPNPATGNQVAAVFNLTKTANVSAVVMDINGRTVKTLPSGSFQKGLNELVISTDGLSKGIYTLSVQTDNAVEATKFVVQ